MTGGTIDANTEYSPEKMAVPVRESNVRKFIESELPEYVAKLRFHQWPPMRDSREFTQKELQEMADTICAAPEHAVLVTHGTDAMANNARALHVLLEGCGKAVLMTGSMRPLSDGPSSDGRANLRFALAAACGEVPAGVYVAMPDEAGRHRLFLANKQLQKHKDREVPYFSGEAH